MRQNNKTVSEMRVYPFMLWFVFGCLLCILTATERIRDRLPRFEGSGQDGPLHKAWSFKVKVWGNVTAGLWGISMTERWNCRLRHESQAVQPCEQQWSILSVSQQTGAGCFELSLTCVRCFTIGMHKVGTGYWAWIVGWSIGYAILVASEVQVSC